MNLNNSLKLVRMLVIGTTIITGILYASMFSIIAFADNWCLGPLACSAIGGDGGDGGVTGDAIAGDIGPGGSCFAKNHVTIGDECGGSTGSSEPRSGSGDHSMNGGKGGSAHNNLEG
ncbi:hypothetical protein [Candidatus Nitrosocosmicus hydrocola]|jgi:hypothetical protein|uniref:hypothetical protein n=1 Tax=Candidatus Nitrosocosmicus hydrocola TaxID=1826872 RepID=UPI0011E5F916|nr:hypothetical protein [Candidatus Nitrosocosmicus hydrocola]